MDDDRYLTMYGHEIPGEEFGRYLRLELTRIYGRRGFAEAFANEIGCPAFMVDDVIAQKRPPSDGMLQALNLQMVNRISYIRKR